MREAFYQLPGAPRLALVTDLHNKKAAPVLASLRARRPELIAIAGDVVYGTRPVGGLSPLLAQANVLPLLRGCAELAPSYFSLGNHELFADEEDAETIRQTGVTYLDDAWVRRGDLVIGGLSSGFVGAYRRLLAALPDQVRASSRYPDEADVQRVRGLMVQDPAPNLGWLREFAAQPGYKLLLCHHPEYYAMLPEGIDLILSGHAHGGQIRLFGQGLFSPGQGLFPRRTRGLYDGRQLVSAGLANTTRLPRLFNPTELCYLNVEP